MGEGRQDNQVCGMVAGGAEVSLGDKHIESNEQFKLPDGTLIGTGCILPLEDDREEAARTYKVFGESFYLDPSDIEELLPTGHYLEQRKRQKPRMRNQGSVGKCNAAATISSIEQIRDREGLPDIVFSDAHLYMNINGGRDGGSLLIDGFKWGQRNGFSPRKLKLGDEEYLFPEFDYNRRQIPERWLREADTQAKQYLSWEPMIIPKDYATFKIALASALARRYPVVHAWHVGSGSMRLSNGYVVQGRGPGNHATCFHSAKWVGGSDLIHPDSKNSWGPTENAIYGPRGSGWGDGGFGLFTMQDAYQCRQYHEFWVMVSSKVNDQEDPLKVAA